MAYQFHAWARKSIAAQITAPDYLGVGTVPPAVKTRVPLDVTVGGKPIPKAFTIAGPGDVIGVSKEMIVRTDPRPNSGDFEPNYLASIEFYDEDFPWRYSPAGPVGENNSRLRPWLMLVVLTENEFQKTTRSKPLSSVIVTDPDALPPSDEIYLWAHAHSMFGDPDTSLEKIIGSLRTKSETDPDGLFSRILCPRKLEEDVLYHAFLVPVFETGRLAGLELDPSGTPVQQPAWVADMEAVELPVYYRWQFRTGARVDFETLLRRMEPRPELDPRIGIKDLVCTQPGYVKVAGEGPVPAPAPGVLGMCGAVKQLTTVADGMEAPIAGQPFVAEVKAHLDLAVQEENLEKDPVVTIPFYGYQHAKTVTAGQPVFTPEKESWLHQVNRDPRNRAAAGLGTLVIQTNQEKLMDSAWKQLPAINEVNRKIKHLQLVMEVNDRLLQTTFNKMGADTGKAFALARPAIAKIKDATAPQTIYQTLTESQVPNATVSAAFRRLTRANGSIARKLNQSGNFSFSQVFARVNPQAVPSVVTVQALPWFTSSAGFQINKHIPTQLPDIGIFNSNIGLKTNLAATTTITTATVAGRTGPFAHAGNPPVVNPGLGAINPGIGAVINPGPGGTMSPGVGGTINPGGGGVIGPIGPVGPIVNTVAVPVTTQVNAVLDQNQAVLSIGIPTPFSTIKIPMDYHAKIIEGLRPANTLLPGFRASVSGLPKPPTTQEEVLPVMAHPDFAQPAYEYLTAINQDFILPNLKLVPPNTIALMEPNYEFIHSFLAGLNHEMSRELLWREFPTDQRGTYFRQFWDPGGRRSPEGTDQAVYPYKDIKPITDWGSETSINDFVKIGKPFPNKPLVLLLKGDLLKKYPNTVVFAQKATWKGDKLVLDETPDTSKFKFPLFSGTLAPDTRLLGFNLTVKEVKGGFQSAGGTILGIPIPTSDPGWFFVLAEVPGEPRFGMDIDYTPPEEGKNTWDNLSAENFDPAGAFVLGNQAPGVTDNGGWPNAAIDGYENAALEKWGRCSADMAGILLQKPAMMAIHGSELLKAFNVS